jgi:hypothetical protein
MDHAVARVHVGLDDVAPSIITLPPAWLDGTR